MGCDGWIVDPEQHATYELRCYQCGALIDLDNPIGDHKNCRDSTGGLPVSIETENWQVR